MEIYEWLFQLIVRIGIFNYMAGIIKQKMIQRKLWMLQVLSTNAVGFMAVELCLLCSLLLKMSLTQTQQRHQTLILKSWSDKLM